ncbi:hypothetical protein F4780DRAFT_789264 [Xylariomycetidae sp. FL0641]|nr:hypothetical protein F4780DRAFT_789264 [Xylariomycetidae sp. FL0641]
MCANEFLMHAILGLAASDLRSEDPSFVAPAMAHRLKAIKSIKESIGNISSSNADEEGNALMATCYALVFQSVSLDDGMAEFMTFARGIAIVGAQLRVRNAKPLFSNLRPEDHMEVVRSRLGAPPPTPREWRDMAVAGLQTLRALCAHPVEVEHCRLLSQVAHALDASSLQAYETIAKHHEWWMQLPHASFQRLIDPGHAVAQLLAAHWAALSLALAPVLETGYRRRRGARGTAAAAATRWLPHVNRQIAADLRAYNAWPAWVEARLREDPRFFFSREARAR